MALGLCVVSVCLASASYVDAQTVIPQTSWSLLLVDSQELLGGNYAGTNSFDGTGATMWHTQWNANPVPPPPHEIQINLGAVYSVNGFRYLPRQDGSGNGRIGQYAFYVRLTGTDPWGSPVATGTFANDASLKEVLFTNKTGQQVRLVALSEVNGNPWTAVAELNVLASFSSPVISSLSPTAGPVGTSVTISGANFGATKGTSTVRFNGTTATTSSWSATSIVASVPAGATTGNVVVTVGGVASNGSPFTVTSGATVIPQTNWTLLFVDSQELVGGNFAATRSFDGTGTTMWHTQWNASPVPPPPHEIQIDLGAVYSMNGFRYLPRQDGIANGRIGQYGFYVRLTGADPWSLVATGTFANDALLKEVLFTNKTGRHVRLVALSEASGNPWTAVAELNVLGTASSEPVISSLSPPTGAVGTSITITGANFGATKGTSTVRFNGTLATTSSWSATSIVASVPAGATTGNVVVTVGGVASNGVLFTVTTGSGVVTIPRTNWTLRFVDSEEVAVGNYAATNSFDGAGTTMWHTRWSNINPDPPPPHDIQIDLGTTYQHIAGFRYLPRQDGSLNGTIGQYEFYVSRDGIHWESPAAAGTFAGDTSEKEASFIPRPARYVHLRALSEVNGNPWTAVAELNILQSTCTTPSVYLVEPRSYFLQTSTDLHVVVDACVTAGQGVRFKLDGGGQVDIYSAPFEIVYTGVSKAEHIVDVFVIDSGGALVPGAATHDQAIQVGIGDYYVAMGDSITVGSGDSIPSDNNSQDGRNTGGGYTPILNNLLTSAKGYPQTVVSEGIGGTTSADGLALISSLLQEHPGAQRFLIMYGTNDSNVPIASGLGLQPGNPGYAGSFKDNMQRIISAIKGAGKVAILAKAPVVLPVGGPRDTIVQNYNLVIDELVAANLIPVSPPDFHAYFATHYPTEYADSLHPNGIGYQSMANLWLQVLAQ
jgi:lysophospholipase L1-like esterase